MNEDELVALSMIKQILKEGLVTWGCTNVKVEIHSPGELEVEFEKNRERFHFYFG